MKVKSINPLENVRFQIETILYYSESGINRAIEEWGQVLLTRYNKKRSFMEADFTVNYLGYYTDNGDAKFYKANLNKCFLMEGKLSVVLQKFSIFAQIFKEFWRSGGRNINFLFLM